MGAEGPLTRRAFAKINLDLRVLGVRPDGYHELRTTFQSIALADTLTFARVRGPFRIDCDDPDCPTDRRNLVWRAARRMWKAARRRGVPRGVHVRITKRIPMQAGLGGGSSDAAAALGALAALWRVTLTRDRLHRMAAALGADVPYFLEGGTVLGVERGDRLFPQVDPPRAWVVLLVPRVGVSTKEAFGWWDAGRARRKAREAHDGQARAGRASNDLQAAVAARHPIVGRLVAALKRAGARHASLSGSGSAVYGLFVRKSEAERAARSLIKLSSVKSLAGQCRHAVVTRTLSRSECRRLAAK
jgi:4-diphosphocytidyl-2-C-methyl-D-erythritol kinase